MEEALAIPKRADLVSSKRTDFTSEQIGIITRLICPGASPDELAMFLGQCRRTGLDPIAKQIYLVKRWDSKNSREVMAIQVSIDGYRLIADRTGMYAGNDDPIFDSEEKPTRATVTVYKLCNGERCPFTATARWDHYYPGDKVGFMWRKMPHLMLGKCAEGLALRKAFPMELSGLYIAEEMEQAGLEFTGEGGVSVDDFITDEQVARIRKLLFLKGKGEKQLLQVVSRGSIEQMLGSDFRFVVPYLERQPSVHTEAEWAAQEGAGS